MKERKKIILIVIFILILIGIIYIWNIKNQIEYRGHDYSNDRKYYLEFFSFYNEGFFGCSSQTDVYIQENNLLHSDKQKILSLKYPTSVFYDWKSADHLNLVIPFNRKAIIDEIEYNNTGVKKFNDFVLRFIPKYRNITITINGEEYPANEGNDYNANCVYLNTDVFGILNKSDK
jgi:hypothetical protein